MAMATASIHAHFPHSCEKASPRRRTRVRIEAGLPPSPLVRAVREGWKLAWRTMMEQLAPSDGGAYRRPGSQFRDEPLPDAQPGRYHLYASPVCPWAHRTLLVHALKRIPNHALPIFLLLPGESGFWEFQSSSSGQHRLLLDVYKQDQASFQGRATVPMLWDSVAMKVVNNESADIIRFLNSHFDHFALNPALQLAPQHLCAEIDKWNEMIYHNVNNGVYRCGFAQSQKAYDAAVNDLFSTLQTLEEHLSSSRFLCGEALTLADIRLFTTLLRFDPVYHGLFKCSKAKLSEFSSIYAYLRDMYQMPGVSETCDLDKIIDGYYRILFPINPSGIKPPVPATMSPAMLLKPHGRA